MEDDEKKHSYMDSIRLSILSQISNDSDSISDFRPEIDYYDEKKWRLSHLKSQFESLELHKLFKKYTSKINYGYYSLFLILQISLCLTHFGVLLYETCSSKEYVVAVLPDLVLYFVTSVISLVISFFLLVWGQTKIKWQYLPFLSMFLLFFINFFVPFYTSFNNTESGFSYIAAYSTLLVISCYLFFDVHYNLVAFLMGFFCSLCHILTLILVTYKNSGLVWTTVFSDCIYILCVNALGLYIRYMNEIVKRRSFLDRRNCIVSMFQLKHEKEQEEQLMSSIIPNYLIKKVKENYLKNKTYFLQNKKYLKQNPFENALLEEHDNVTILFADIVHYTEMTVKLNIKDLIETLNELFGRFDEASEKLGVVRIKFLGDCYYCVAGLPPDPVPNPAEACVDLGLKMINIIVNVREERNLTINMRIGIHTGKIISGIIGAVKYQFDIWSKDVDIANKMESEGSPGKVHITKQTKDLLTKPYDITQTDKGNTVPQFKQHNIETFLVTPLKKSPSIADDDEDISIPNQPRTSMFRKNGFPTTFLNHLHSVEEDPLSDANGKPAENPLTFIESNNLDQNRKQSQNFPNERRTTVFRRNLSNNRHRITEERRITADMKRRTAFMNNNIKRYTERSVAVNQEMEKMIDSMTFSKKHQYTKVKDISSLLLFRNKRDELEYIKKSDPLFKYYILSQVVLIFCVYLIQNLTLNQWGTVTWQFLVSETILIFVLIPLTWTQFLNEKWGTVTWQFLVSETILIFVLIPLTWTQFLYEKYVSKYASVEPQNKFLRFFYRASRYITDSFWTRVGIYSLAYVLFAACVIIEVFECGNILGEYTDSTHHYCKNSWHMTKACSLALIMTFIFLRIVIWIKYVYGIIVAAIYIYVVMNDNINLYKNSPTYNYMVDPKISHVLSIVFLLFILHLIDRQTDYMNRLDHLWNRKLLDDQKKANEQQLVNKNLLINILPKHVAKIYLDVNREMNDYYSEPHNNVAVMFASIIFDDDMQEVVGEKAFLRLMNEYITSFDTLINRKEFCNVEKIKIAKWTYMAACGLFPGGITNEIERHSTTATLETLLSFASHMYKKFKEINGVLHNCQLRIGICHGPIVAGVVGSKKPLYDIWGDPVNMASRMDSTGVPDRIQVMEETANIIENLGYVCEYRGQIKVKGREDLVKTYFVKLNDNYDLVKEELEMYHEK